MIVVFARLRARAAHADEVESTLRSLEARTREEPGALGYAVLRCPDYRFLVFERYADQAACDAHFAAPYVTDFLARTGEWLVEAPEVHMGPPL